MIYDQVSAYYMYICVLMSDLKVFIYKSLFMQGTCIPRLIYAVICLLFQDLDDKSHVKHFNNLLLDRVYSRILSNMAEKFLDLNFTLLIIIRLGK